MKTTTALILEYSDFTKDKNLKFEAFEAMCHAEIVIRGSAVIKNRPTGEISEKGPDMSKGPAKRVRRARTPEVTIKDDEKPKGAA